MRWHLSHDLNSVKRAAMSRSEERECRSQEQMHWCRNELAVLKEKMETGVPGRKRENKRVAGDEV